MVEPISLVPSTNRPDVTSPSEPAAAKSAYAEVYDPAKQWEDIEDDVVAVTLDAFYDDESVPKDRLLLAQSLKRIFVNPENFIIVIRSHTGNVVGYAITNTSDMYEQPYVRIAYDRGTAIHSDYQGRKLLPKLLLLGMIC